MKEKNEFSSPFQIQKTILSELNEEKGKEWFNSCFDVQYEIYKEIAGGGEGSFIREAPADGSLYVRGNEEWQKLPNLFEAKVVDELPTASADTMGVIYFVPSEDASTGNIKDEFITIEVDGGYVWEKIGSTAVDLNNYYTKAQVDASLNEKQDNLISGVNIKTINGSTLLGSGNIEIEIPEDYVMEINQDDILGQENFEKLMYLCDKGKGSAIKLNGRMPLTYEVAGNRYRVLFGVEYFDETTNTIKYQDWIVTADDAYCYEVEAPFLQSDDLNNYYTKAQVDASLNTKQNTLTAGEGIDITNNVISATIDEKETLFIENGETWTQDLKDKVLEYIENKDFSHIVLKTVLTDETTTWNINSVAAVYNEDSDYLVGFGQKGTNVTTVVTMPNALVVGYPIQIVTRDIYYYTKSETNDLLNLKQDTLIAGTNITIDASNVISVDIDTDDYATKEEVEEDEEIVAETVRLLNENINLKQDTLFAGENITIDASNVISANIDIDIIDDETTSLSKTWSSNKLSGELNEKVNSDYINDIWRGTEDEYEALGTYDNNTLYIITETPVPSGATYRRVDELTFDKNKPFLLIAELGQRDISAGPINYVNLRYSSGDNKLVPATDFNNVIEKGTTEFTLVEDIDDAAKFNYDGTYQFTTASGQEINAYYYDPIYASYAQHVNTSEQPYEEQLIGTTDIFTLGDVEDCWGDYRYSIKNIYWGQSRPISPIVGLSNYWDMLNYPVFETYDGEYEDGQIQPAEIWQKVD